MKKKILLVLLILLMLFINAHSETLITYGGTFSQKNSGYQEFCEENPDVQLMWSDADYYPASAFVTALLTGEFKCDLFTQQTDQADWINIMSKGYCLDLSKSVILSEAIQNMYPSIANQGMFDGHLYAIPTQISFTYYRVNIEPWIGMGFTLEDVPQSFSEFLDFLAMWCDRVENDPELEVVAFGGWDNPNSSTYTIFLTEMLINEIIMEKQYYHEDLVFDDNELLELLGRCLVIGDRLSQCENKSYSWTLFEQYSSKIWPETSACIVYPKINDNCPKLIKSRASMWAINANSKHADLCIKLLEKAAVGITNFSHRDDLFIYQNSQPRINPNYESDKEYWTKAKDAVVVALQDDDISGENKYDLEDKLSSYNEAIKRTEANKWLVSPEQLADYQNVVNGLYFAPINVFDNSSEGYEVIENYCSQFANHMMDASQLIKKLNSCANMLRMEQDP